MEGGSWLTFAACCACGQSEEGRAEVFPAPQDSSKYNVAVKAAMENGSHCSKLTVQAQGQPKELPVGGWEFTVRLEKKADDKLGIEVQAFDCMALQINRVGPGLVQDWNNKEPEMRVIPTDIILEVNGIKGDLQSIIACIAQDEVLSMVLLRLQRV
eukprot:NODE_23084_length_681_cov_3.425993.p2 GENE.NODE_23084_length_681_cov_3.425993~~NODE_23084_length_681_cov_3.425993.p2  ORF type:complete len:156 (-),score=26.68 NODE_23084_length_681_cov_3.425993:165-632(-)